MDDVKIPEPSTLGEVVALFEPSSASDPESRAGQWLKRVESEAFLDAIPEHLANVSLLFMEWLNLLRQSGLDLSAVLSVNKPREVLEVPRTYHSAMHHLWQCEFSMASTAVLPNFWKYIRDHATMTASAFRVAMEWYYLINSGEVVVGSAAPSYDLRAMLPSEIAPRINVTPWLDGEVHAYMPHYLWDLKQKATVEVQKLSTKPEYVAISHTWGRFRKMNGEKPCYVTLPGVPWDVPELQNSKFNVLDLPDMLYNGLGDKTEFVWIDLFCIPQDRSPLSLQEIGRQASIFRNSAATLAWLNEIDGWAGTQDTLRFICSFAIRDWGREGLITSDAATTLLPPPSHRLELATGESLNPWFTSLWTLQEICLCPKMEIHDRKFEPLRIADGLRPLCFSEIQALIDCVSNIKDMSTNVQDLDSLLRNILLPTTEDWSPMTILHLGNRRYWEERRAEAIMSVVGAVEWFNSSPSTVLQAPESLILGLYPPTFIAEVRRKYGSGTFFHAAKPKYSATSSILFNGISSNDLEDFGSMLPFGPGAPSAGVPTAFGQSSEPTTESWVIDERGRVHIAEAFIQLSQDDADPRYGLQCAFKSPALTDSTVYDDHWEGLGQDYPALCRWIKEFQPRTRNYAVRLTVGEHWCQGILLKELESGELLKASIYVLARPSTDTVWPGAKQEVEWVVL